MNRIAAVWPFKKKQKNDPNDPVPPYTPPYDPTMEPFIQGISSASPETRMEIYRQLVAAGYSPAAASTFLEHQQHLLGNGDMDDYTGPYPPGFNPAEQVPHYQTTATAPAPSQQPTPQQQHPPNTVVLGVEEYEAALLELVLKRSAEEARMRAAEEADDEAAVVAALLASTAIEANAERTSANAPNSPGLTGRPFSVASSFSIPSDYGEGPSQLLRQTIGQGSGSGSSGAGASRSGASRASGGAGGTGSSTSSPGGNVPIPVVGTIMMVPFSEKSGIKEQQQQQQPQQQKMGFDVDDDTLTRNDTVTTIINGDNNNTSPKPLPMEPSASSTSASASASGASAIPGPALPRNLTTSSTSSNQLPRNPTNSSIHTRKSTIKEEDLEVLKRKSSSPLASIIANVIGNDPAFDAEAAVAAANAIAERITTKAAVLAANKAAEEAAAAAAGDDEEENEESAVQASGSGSGSAAQEVAPERGLEEEIEEALKLKEKEREAAEGKGKEEEIPVPSAAATTAPMSIQTHSIEGAGAAMSAGSDELRTAVPMPNGANTLPGSSIVPSSAATIVPNSSLPTPPPATVVTPPIQTPQTHQTQQPTPPPPTIPSPAPSSAVVSYAPESSGYVPTPALSDIVWVPPSEVSGDRSSMDFEMSIGVGGIDAEDPLWEIDKMEEKEWAEMMRQRMKDEIEREMVAEARRAEKRKGGDGVSVGAETVEGSGGGAGESINDAASEASSDLPSRPTSSIVERPSAPTPPSSASTFSNIPSLSRASTTNTPPSPALSTSSYLRDIHRQSMSADISTMMRRREILEMLERERRVIRMELEREIAMERERARKEEREGRERIERAMGEVRMRERELEMKREEVARKEREQKEEVARLEKEEMLRRNREKDEQIKERQQKENQLREAVLRKEREAREAREAAEAAAVAAAAEEEEEAAAAVLEVERAENPPRFSTLAELMRAVEAGTTLSGEEALMLREFLFDSGNAGEDASEESTPPPPLPPLDIHPAQAQQFLSQQSGTYPNAPPTPAVGTGPGDVIPASALLLPPPPPLTQPWEYALRSNLSPLPPHLSLPSSTVVSFDPKKMSQLPSLDSYLYRLPGSPPNASPVTLPAFSVLSNEPLTTSAVGTTFCAYFEVTLAEADPDAIVSVGLATEGFPGVRCPGWHPISVAYLSTAERVHCVAEWEGEGGIVGEGGGNTHQIRSPFGMTFAAGDTIGCGYIPAVGGVFFTLNGEFLGEAFSLLGSPPDMDPGMYNDTQGNPVIPFYACVGAIAPMVVTQDLGGNGGIGALRRRPGGDGCVLHVNFGAGAGIGLPPPGYTGLPSRENDFKYAPAKTGEGRVPDEEVMSQTSDIDDEMERALAASLETSAAEAAKAELEKERERVEAAARESGAVRKKTWDSNARGSSIYIGRTNTTSTASGGDAEASPELTIAGGSGSASGSGNGSTRNTDDQPLSPASIPSFYYNSGNSFGPSSPISPHPSNQQDHLSRLYALSNMQSHQRGIGSSQIHGYPTTNSYGSGSGYGNQGRDSGSPAFNNIQTNYRSGNLARQHEHQLHAQLQGYNNNGAGNNGLMPQHISPHLRSPTSPTPSQWRDTTSVSSLSSMTSSVPQSWPKERGSSGAIAEMVGGSKGWLRKRYKQQKEIAAATSPTSEDGGASGSGMSRSRSGSGSRMSSAPSSPGGGPPKLPPLQTSGGLLKEYGDEVTSPTKLSRMVTMLGKDWGGGGSSGSGSTSMGGPARGGVRTSSKYNPSATSLSVSQSVTGTPLPMSAQHSATTHSTLSMLSSPSNSVVSHTSHATIPYFSTPHNVRGSLNSAMSPNPQISTAGLTMGPYKDASGLPIPPWLTHASMENNGGSGSGGGSGAGGSSNDRR
ncbi:Rsp5p-dependent ubiquitination, sorting of cargo proteins at the multivesicular body [Phlyctochytrium planicorne]|nr:Rsp5p-dependent ubiquitination, sorting of cargo proteins at the multivesicular body [Phlyctochytrium planicorne]